MDSSTGFPIQRDSRFDMDNVRAGVVAGLAGGLVMGVIAMVIAANQADLDMWVPLKQVSMVGQPGGSGVEPGFELGPVVTGLVIHGVTSMVLGLVFALLYSGLFRLPLSLGLPFLTGGVYGVAIYFLSQYVLAAVNPVMASSEKPQFFLGHLAYGIGLGLVYHYLSLQNKTEAVP